MYSMLHISVVSIVYLEMDAYHVVEEDGSVSVAVVRDGELSRMTTVLFTTHQDTALGMYICRNSLVRTKYI